MMDSMASTQVMFRSLSRAVVLLALGVASLAAQDSLPLPLRVGSEFRIPLASVLLPGIGQYVQGAPRTGVVYTTIAAGGLAVALNGPSDTADFPRGTDSQITDVAGMFAQSASWLSAWDAFHRAVPAMQQRGKYTFLPPRRESVPQLLSAPFDVRFLKRWTTWVDIAQTGLVTALILSDRGTDEEHYPYRAQDAAYAVSISGNAAVGEEAFFRGYLFPMLYQKTGQRFWLANTSQALIFTVGHGASPTLLITHTPWALWEGWLVRRNNWSIRESVFHQFWYDAAVITAIALADEKPVTLRLRFPTITF
jgi:hypothetical protein